MNRAFSGCTHARLPIYNGPNWQRNHKRKTQSLFETRVISS